MTTFGPPTLTWRDLLQNIVPRWLKGPLGNRLMYTIGLHLDAIGDAHYFGVRARYPGQQADALSLIGRQRGIVAGPNEQPANYAERLRFWRQSRKRKGTYFALLEQLQAYLAPSGYRTAIVQDQATVGGEAWRYELAPLGYPYSGTNYASAPVNTVLRSAISWNWDGTADPNRYWIILYGPPGSVWPSGPAYANDGTYSTAPLIGMNEAIGSSAGQVDVQSVLSIIRDWNPPHARPQHVILAFNAGTYGTIAPDGTWNRPSRRSPFYNYWNI